MSAATAGTRTAIGAMILGTLAALCGCVPGDRTDDGEENGSVAREQQEEVTLMGTALAESLDGSNIDASFISCTGSRQQYIFKASMADVTVATQAEADAATERMRDELEALGYEVSPGETSDRVTDPDHPDLEAFIDQVPPPDKPYLGFGIKVTSSCEIYSEADDDYADSVNYGPGASPS